MDAADVWLLLDRSEVPLHLHTRPRDLAAHADGKGAVRVNCVVALLRIAPPPLGDDREIRMLLHELGDELVVRLVIVERMRREQMLRVLRVTGQRRRDEIGPELDRHGRLLRVGQVGHERHVLERAVVADVIEHVQARPTERAPALGHVESDDVRTSFDQVRGRDESARDEHLAIVVLALVDPDDDRLRVELVRRLHVGGAADAHCTRAGIEHLFGHERDVLRLVKLASELWLGLTGNDETALHAAQDLGLAGHALTPAAGQRIVVTA